MGVETSMPPRERLPYFRQSIQRVGEADRLRRRERARSVDVNEIFAAKLDGLSGVRRLRRIVLNREPISLCNVVATLELKRLNTGCDSYLINNAGKLIILSYVVPRLRV